MEKEGEEEDEKEKEGRDVSSKAMKFAAQLTTSCLAGVGACWTS